MSLTPAAAAAVVRRRTGLRARHAVELGRGSDSVAYLVDDDWVFRFPLVPNAQRTLRRELALLPALQAVLPVPVPQLEHIARGSDGGYAFAGYRLLRGVPLTVDRFAELPAAEQHATLAALAEFLTALHSFPTATARSAGVAFERFSGGYHTGQRALVRDVAPLLSTAEVARLDTDFARHDAERRPGATAAVLLHADLKPAHVLYDLDARRVGGVLDWGDVSLGDRDFDLAVIALFFGDAFLERLLAHLPERDPGPVADAVRFFKLLRAVQDLAYSRERGDGSVVAAGLRGLRERLAND